MTSPAFTIQPIEPAVRSAKSCGSPDASTCAPPFLLDNDKHEVPAAESMAGSVEHDGRLPPLLEGHRRGLGVQGRGHTERLPPRLASLKRDTQDSQPGHRGTHVERQLRGLVHQQIRGEPHLLLLPELPEDAVARGRVVQEHSKGDREPLRFNLRARIKRSTGRVKELQLLDKVRNEVRAGERHTDMMPSADRSTAAACPGV